MKAYGSQILAEFIHCQTDLLSHKEALTEILTQGIQKYQLDLKSINSFQFDPIGVTAIAIIGESHVAIHTYPEEQHASIDIFTCSPGSPGPPLLLNYLKEKLKPQSVRHKVMHRGNTISVKETNYVQNLSKGEFDVRYHIQNELLNQRTSYQHIHIIENHNFGKMLFLDQELQIASGDANIYYEALLHPLLSQKGPLKKIAILGGGDGGALKGLTQSTAEKIFLVDIDSEVIKAAKIHLKEICGQAFTHPKAKIVIAEAQAFIGQQTGFDGIVYDLNTAPEVAAALDKPSYLKALFKGIYQSLKPGGVLSLQCCSTYDEVTFQQLKTLLQCHFSGLEFRDVFIPSFCGRWRFGSARKPTNSSQ